MKIIEILPLKNPIETELTIPGSKSYTNRALFLAAMTKNKVKIINPLISDDTMAMISCLQKLGIKIEVFKDAIDVIGSIGYIKDGYYDLDANLSGITIRFLLALSAVVPGVKTLYGREELNKRPIGGLVGGLRQLGAKVEYLDRDGFPPLRSSSSTLNPGTVKINGETSSQYLSAVLLISPLVGEISIKVMGEQTSKPYIDMTIEAMNKFGVNVVNNDYKNYVAPGSQKYNANEYLVEGDYSSASYFLAIAALTGSTFTLKNLNPNSLQADRKIIGVLEKMGNVITSDKNSVKIIGKGVKAVSTDMVDFPDQVQTIAVLSAFAKGKTEIRGIKSLRIKETDRVSAIIIELGKMGINTKVLDDKLVVYGGNPRPASIDTYGDHRMAMSIAVAGTKLSGMEIKNPEVVTKTFPDFWKRLEEVGVKIV